MDYVVGYIFLSGKNIVFDAGDKEFPLESVGNFEIWNGSEFVSSTQSDIKIPKMLGAKASFKV